MFQIFSIVGIVAFKQQKRKRKSFERHFYFVKFWCEKTSWVEIKFIFFKNEFIGVKCLYTFTLNTKKSIDILQNWNMIFPGDE